MRALRNEEAIRRVQAASFRGESPATMKPLYIEQNVFDIGLDDPIFRIFQIEYLQKDIAGSALTLTKAHPKTWGDPLENPLLNASYPDVETGGTLDLHGVLDFHALSWTKSPNENASAWAEFSHGQPAIRIETTPRLLLDRLMNVEDTWYMLRYHIGLVKYEDAASIAKWISQPDYSAHLDSLGQGLAFSLMRLRTCFQEEEEVRLLFSEHRNPGCDWARANIKMSEKLATVPFEWPGAVLSATFGSNVSASDQQAFKSCMANRGVSCPIGTSKY